MQAAAASDLDSASINAIDASRRGDRTAFTQIIERYQRAVYAVAFSSVRDRALADDVTQDTFVIAWRRLDELRDPSRLPAWLCGIARNLGRDARKRMRRETLCDADTTVALDAPTAYEAMSEIESERLVAAALGQVPDTYREPLVLYYYEDRSVDDVARSLGISAATTNKRLSRGRQFLAERVATLVERGLATHGPRAGLAASVLAIIGITAPASHVDASPAPVKGSTMKPLAIAALATVAVGGGAALVAVTASNGNAQPSTLQSTAHPHGTVAAAEAKADPWDCPLTAGAHGAAKNAPALPSLATLFGGAGAATASTAGATDCAAVGRHLAELEADATHGPSDRPDEATCEKCAGHYTTQCESGDWSLERRTCTLAAADLVNAHLCAGNPAKVSADTKPAEIPANLTCTALGAHIGPIVDAAHLYPGVSDMAQQIDAACEMANWTLELRQCFAASTTVDGLKDCFMPAP
jgi:RNA polymerase sigma factor (sigma-70 family)